MLRAQRDPSGVGTHSTLAAHFRRFVAQLLLQRLFHPLVPPSNDLATGRTMDWPVCHLSVPPMQTETERYVPWALLPLPGTQLSLW